MAELGKKGVLLVNLGTPDSPRRGDVYRYLRQFLLDARVVDYPWLARQLLVQGIIAPFRSGSSAKLYQKLWTEAGSPLKVYGERLAAGVQERLGKDYVVELAMRYQNPSIPHAIQRLLDRQVSEIVVFPLFPQYASATTGSVHEAVMRELAGKQAIPNVRLINSYYDHPAMIRIFADNARRFDLDSYDHILFSYHGLPKRQLRKGDPSGRYCQQVKNCCQRMSAVNQFCYSAQCHATTRAIAAELGLSPDRYTTTFQSRLGPEEWAKPYTSAVLEEKAEAGAKRLLVFSPAFVADCLETLIEISYEYQEEFEEMGGEQVDLVPSLNDDPRWMDLVAELVADKGYLVADER
jgi:ferrochelatase